MEQIDAYIEHTSAQEIYKEAVKAKDRIAKYARITPLEFSPTLSGKDQKVFLKLECQQKTRSFKLRGASNKLLSLSEEEKAMGIIAVSSGNHGAAVSYVAAQEHIENAKIIVPKNTPLAKVNKIKAYGSEVFLEGDNYDAAHSIGHQMVADNQMTYVDAYDYDPKIYGGQGTIGLELIEQLPDIDTVLVPIGGGGIITGIGAVLKALKPDLQVIGVQTEACPAMKASMKDHVCYEAYPTKESVCEALVGGVGRLAYKLSEEIIDDIIIVKESWIKKALYHMVMEEKIIAEPSSVTGVAAVMYAKKALQGKNIAVVITGGNIDETLMLEILNQEHS